VSTRCYVAPCRLSSNGSRIAVHHEAVCEPSPSATSRRGLAVRFLRMTASASCVFSSRTPLHTESLRVTERSSNGSRLSQMIHKSVHCDDIAKFPDTQWHSRLLPFPRSGHLLRRHTHVVCLPLGVSELRGPDYGDLATQRLQTDKEQHLISRTLKKFPLAAPRTS